MKNRWEKYVQRGGSCYVTDPNEFVVELAKILPDYVDTIVEIGCTNGRDFIPFADPKYHWVGIDYHDVPIDWIVDSKRVEYLNTPHSKLIETLDRRFEQMERVVFLSSFTLYPLKQNRLVAQLFDFLERKGCRNIVLREPIDQRDYNWWVDLGRWQSRSLSTESKE